MKRLEDIPKKAPFEVPDGYFDRLPGTIQARVAKQQGRPAFSWTFAMRLAVPIFLLAVVGIFWYRTDGNVAFSVVAELETVEEDQLTQFLNDTDLTTEELVETVTWSEGDIRELENHVYSSIEVSNEQLENLLDQF